MKYQKPYRWKSKKIYEENKGWMGKSIGKCRTDDSEDPFFSHFLPFRFLLEKQHRSVKNCPNFSKINFSTLFCQILLVFLHFSSISFNFLFQVLIFLFAVRFRYAQSTHWGTLIRPPYPPQRSLAFARSYVPLFIFFSLLIKNFHK